MSHPCLRVFVLPMMRSMGEESQGNFWVDGYPEYA
jgi:hypothetical protein